MNGIFGFHCNYFMPFSVSSGVALTGERLAKTKGFLHKMGLAYECGAEYTVQLLSEYGDILGNGCLCGRVLKYIAVDPSLQGEGGATAIISELVSEAYRRGITKLFLFTKAGNEDTFRGVGFYTVVATDEVCFMENSRRGIDRWLSSLKKAPEGGVVGAAVMNCNPFTLGHRYLIETAAAQVDTLMVFVVSEDKSRFSFDQRYRMVQRGTEDIKNVIVQPSGDYMISHATFPTYFMKEGQDKLAANARLDLELFGRRIAPALNITRRFVGTEPYCAVTRSYNELMKAMLPAMGVEVTEIPRIGGISASRVREALDRGDLQAIGGLVPASTLSLLAEHEA